ncbi:MAG: TonB family protein [Bacteroidota bacterium]
MQIKKNPEVSLENYRAIFFEIGLIISLFIVYLVLESKSDRRIDTDMLTTQTIFVDEIEVPVTERKTDPALIKKPPPAPVTQIIVVADNTIIEQELEIETTEIDEDTEIEFKTKKAGPIAPIMEEEEEEEVYNFQIVESQPIYPGCEGYSSKQSRYMCFQKQIMAHVKKNFKYPEVAKEMGIQGRVIIKFVIGKDGIIKDVGVLRGIDKSLDEEALRIVEALPKMTPATQRGRPVPVSFMLPINFQLQ